MKEYYYYMRTRRNAPIVTVCLISDNDTVYRGVAICSRRDNPVKEKGRALARKRAWKAFHSKRDSFPIHGKSEIRALLRLDTGDFLTITKFIKIKSASSPDLTNAELNILAEPPEKGESNANSTIPH